MRRVGVFAALSALLLSPAAWGQAAEQDIELIPPGPRQGFYLGGGLRLGLLHTDSDETGAVGPVLGQGLSLRTGQMMDQHFGLGLVLRMIAGGNSTWGTALGGLSLEGTYVPFAGEAFALRASVGPAGGGVARAKEEDRNDDDDPIGGYGAMYTLGFSHEMFPLYEEDSHDSGGLAFSAIVESFLMPADGLFVGGLQISLEVTYWFGFQKSRLDIPPEAY